MTYHIPLTVLAVAAIATGYVGLYPQFAGSYLAHGLPHHESDWAGLFVLWGLLTTAVGGALAYFYSRQPAEPLERLLKDNYADLKQGFYFDRLWENFGTYVVAPVGQFMAFIDEILVSGVLAKGSAAFVGLVGIFAKSTYRNLITYTLYWLLAGVLIFILLINR